MKIGLFIPCYVDAVYPEVGVATYKLLTSLGLDVTYPLNQTCCGQPMGNAGFEKMGLSLAEKFEEMFKDFDYVVAPSVSCTAFVKINYPRLLEGTHECVTASKIMDVVEFLHDVVKVEIRGEIQRIRLCRGSFGELRGLRANQLSPSAERQA